jgi:hypothetical protein
MMSRLIVPPYTQALLDELQYGAELAELAAKGKGGALRVESSC